MKSKLNKELFSAIFLLITIVFIFILFIYAGIEEGTADYGKWNGLVKGLSNLVSFPFHYLIATSISIIYFIGYFINISFYAFLVYFLIRKIRSF